MNMIVLAVASVLLASPCLVPAPQEMTRGDGVCRLSAPVVERKDSTLPAEGYALTVSEKGIEIASSDAAGAFYARETLKQLETVTAGGTNYPCCTIRDWPAYRWRGVLIDECRHFFGREALENVIDTMAMHKLNVLHWHLTEDQGWRMDIPSMPELVKYGSVRPSSPRRGAELQVVGKFKYRSDAHDGVPYGPFYYTEADLRHIVAYASARHITVVPEVDLPGHMRSAIAAYPELTCFPENITNRMAHNEWGVTTDVLCLGKDETVRFLERVFDFVCDVFPSEVIHIGGDECPRLSWEKCSKCRARMEAEGMKSPGELQAWITRRMADYLAKKGRRIIGWDEILHGDVPQSAIGQSWRTQSGNGAGTELVKGAEAVGRGHDMVISPHTECYYNYRQGLTDDPFQYAGLPLPLERAYRFDPMTGLPLAARKHILGSEACLWSEYIWDPSEREWKLWPRGCAMAELLWTNPQPRKFKDFRNRMTVHRKRLIKRGVNCAPLE